MPQRDRDEDQRGGCGERTQAARRLPEDSP